MNRQFDGSAKRRPLSSFLSAAAGRYFSVLAFSEAPAVLNFLFVAAVLLLLAGTLLIHPGWLFVAAAAGLVFAGVRVRKRWLTRYRLAQLLDHRLHLDDSLSTAWFLIARTGDRDSPTATRQIEGAESLAAAVQPGQAFPFEWSSAWIVPGILAMVMLALFALRYGRSDRFDLRPSLLPLTMQALLASHSAEASELHPEARRPNQQNKDGLLNPDRAGVPLGERANDKNAVQPTDGQNGAKSVAAGSAEKSINDLQEQQQLASDQQKDSSHSLLSQMQNTVGGLMAKMQQALKPGDPRAQKDSKKGETSPDDEKNSQAGDANSKSSSPQSSSSENERGDASSQANAGQPQAIEKSNSTAQLGNAKQPANESGDNSQSGAGRNDGRKETRDAEQLKALGKLEEIIGKRSASVTGDMTIEKPSGKQQLQTDYSNEIGHHSDLGGEIDRDEVPPEYRAYIRAYMEAMHKQAPPGHQ